MTNQLTNEQLVVAIAQTGAKVKAVIENEGAQSFANHYEILGRLQQGLARYSQAQLSHLSAEAMAQELLSLGATCVQGLASLRTGEVR